MTDQKNPVQFVSADFYAFWKFQTTHPNCPICQDHFETTCIDCQQKDTKKNTDCPVSKGKCGHCFHKHCITKWLVKSTICPICKTPYMMDVENINNNEDWKKLVAKR
jgi:E3 ubiquitin-protein ligase RBX1